MQAHRTAQAEDEYQLSKEHMDPNAPRQDSPTKKKSVMDKFKDMAKGEAKKLKTKMRRKSQDNENEEDESSGCSSSEGNDQNEPSLGHQQENQSFQENGGSCNTSNGTQEAPGSETLQERFGRLTLESGKDADTTPEDGIGRRGSDLLVSSHEVGDGFPAGDQGDEKPLKECEGESKSLKDSAYEELNASKEKFDGVTAGDAEPVGYDAAGRSTEAEKESKKETEEKKSLSLLEQAREKIFGSKKSFREGSHPATIEGQQGEQQDKTTDVVSSDVISSDETKPTMTRRATETVWGIKDKVASKIGYGSFSAARDEGAAADQERVGRDDKASEEEKTTGAVSRFSPGEEEKELSKLITDAMSSSAASVKGKLTSPFTRSSSSSLPASTPRSTSPGGTKATATEPAPATTDRAASTEN